MGTAKRSSGSGSRHKAKPKSIRLVACGRGDDLPSIQSIPIDKIDLNRRLCQFRIHEDGLGVLAKALSRGDQINAILVRRIEDGYEVIDGFSRVQCLLELGRTEVLARVYEGLNDEEAVALAYESNADRKSLSPVERALGIARWIELTKKSMAEAAEFFHFSPKQLRRYLKLLELPDELMRAVRQNGLPMGHALILRGHARISYDEWIRRIEDEKLSRKKLRQLLNQTPREANIAKPLFVLKQTRLTIARRSVDLDELTVDETVQLRDQYRKLTNLLSEKAGEISKKT